MKIAILLVTSLLLFAGSLFLEKAVVWGYLIPWCFVGIGFFSLIAIYMSKLEIRDAAGSESFGEILLNSLGLIVIVIGFISNQIAPSLIFLAEIWLVTIYINRLRTRILKPPSGPR